MPNYSQNGGHNHTLQVSEIPSHDHSMSGGSNVGLTFEKDDFVIDINKGVMVSMHGQPAHNNKIIDDDIFLNNMCDCIVSRFVGHNINLFKVGNSIELKKMVLNFLKKEIE
jgi:hypothetical protein